MFSVWPSRGFDAGCQAVNTVGQNVCARLEHPVGFLELAVAVSYTCVSVCLHFGTPCYRTCVGSPCLQTNLCVDLIGQNRSCVRPLLQASSNDLLRCCRNQFIKRPAPSVSCLISVCRLL